MAYDLNILKASLQVCKVLNCLNVKIKMDKPFKLYIETDYGIYAAYSPQIITDTDGNMFSMAHAIVKEHGKPYAKFDHMTEREQPKRQRKATR